MGVSTRGEQLELRFTQGLLSDEHVESRTLADAEFLAHAVKGDLAGLHLSRLDLDIGAARVGLVPGRQR